MKIIFECVVWCIRDGDDHLDWDGAEPGQGAAPNPENPNEEWEVNLNTEH